jgi:hypothetical protein
MERIYCAQDEVPERYLWQDPQAEDGDMMVITHESIGDLVSHVYR